MSTLICRWTIALLLLVSLAGCRGQQKLGVSPPDTIVVRLQDSNPDMRAAGLEECIGRQVVPPDAVELVVKQLSDDNRIIRMLAARVLNIARPEDAKQYIDKMEKSSSKEPDQEVRDVLDEAIFRLRNLP